jgi:poly-gamma-glutamate capsule biosynthesis protein CapA/YwtB (metallophosphatase superfamily)
VHRPALPVTLGLVLIATLLAACSGTSGDAVAGSGDRRSSSTTAGPDPTATNGEPASPTTGADRTDRAATGSGQAVTLAFGGDSSFQNQTAAVVSSPSTVLSAIAPVLSGADLAMVNLETALGKGGTPQAKKFTFQVPEQAVDALKAAGVDAVTMANNHGMDYGPAGMADTLRIKQSTGFPILGVGADENEAYAPLITKVKGQRIGILAASDVFDDNLRASWLAGPGKAGLASAEEDHRDRLLQAVKDARGKVDTLVVYLHMGTEKEFCPNPRQKELAQMLTDAGVDIVVGSHTHRVQGAGYLGDHFVAYGMGNFIFKANSPEGAATGVLVVTATGRTINGYEWKPAVIRNSIPFPLTGQAATAAQGTMDQRQACAGLSARAGPAPGTGAGTP